MRKARITVFLVIATLIIAALSVQIAFTYPQYAQQTGQPCSYCHVNPAGGAELTAAGQYYKQHNTLQGYTPPAQTQPTTPPAETQPATPPAETQPATPPAETQPATPPAETTPPTEVTPPAETAPSETPTTPAAPEVTPPTETTPPAETTPPTEVTPPEETAPSETAPSEAAPAAPEVTPPAETAPPAEAAPSVPAETGGYGTTSGMTQLPRTGADMASMLALSFAMFATGSWLYRRRQ